MNTNILEAVSMGRVTTIATIENLEDCWEVKRGLRSPHEVRRIEVADAVIDTGTTGLSIPTSLIQQLGLARIGTRPTLTASGPTTAAREEPVRLIIHQR